MQNFHQMKRLTSVAMSFWAVAGLASTQFSAAAAQPELSSESMSRISRIVGGTVAPNHAYPWVVALETVGVSILRRNVNQPYESINGSALYESCVSSECSRWDKPAY